MSLSPKDDPRTWLVPGRQGARPPLHARLLYYVLTKSQRALLRAMHEYAPEGSLWEACLDTYAKTSGLSVRHIWNLIHGWERNGRRTLGLLELRVLECKREARRGPFPKPAAYAFNEWALKLRPEVVTRQEAGVQQRLPMEGASKVNHPSAPAQAQFRQPLPKNSETVAEYLGNRCRDGQRISETVADDSKATTTTTVNSPPGGFVKSTPGEVSNSHSELKDLAKKLCEKIAFPATQSNVTAVAAALEAVRRQNGLSRYETAYNWLMPRAAKAQKHPHQTRRSVFDRFFFEDAIYNHVDPRSDAQIRAEIRAEHDAYIADEVAAGRDPCVGKCQGCCRPRFASSTWKDFCADSCRADYERRQARGGMS
jgi:hypothetical protein